MASPSSDAARARGDAHGSAPDDRGAPLWPALIPILLHALLAWVGRARTLGTGNDDALYLLLARALRSGHYRELFQVGTPVHAQYPPLYPALVALLGAPGDGRIGLVVAAGVLVSCVGLLFLFDALRHRGLALGLAVITVAAVNPALVSAAGRVQSEPLFMALLIVGFWGLRARAPDGARPWALAALIAAALTRTAGVPILGGVGLYLLARREWSTAARFALLCGVTVGAWVAWTALAPTQTAGRSYVADALLERPPPPPSGTEATPPGSAGPDGGGSALRQVLDRPRRTIPAYLGEVLPWQLALPTMTGARWDNVVGVAVMGATLLAGLAVSRRAWPAPVYGILAYGALLAFWPYVIARYLTPVLPLLLAWMLLGTRALGGRLGHRSATAAVLMVSGYLLVGAFGGRSRWCDDPGAASAPECGFLHSPYASSARAVATEAGPGRALTVKEATFFYWTGVQVLPVHAVVGLGAAELERALQEADVRILFLPHLKPEEESLVVPLQGLCPRLTAVTAPYPHQLVLRARPPRPGEADGCFAVERWRETW